VGSGRHGGEASRGGAGEHVGRRRGGELAAGGVREKRYDSLRAGIKGVGAKIYGANPLAGIRAGARGSAS
jgi:hypothetical protein